MYKPYLEVTWDSSEYSIHEIAIPRKDSVEMQNIITQHAEKRHDIKHT